MRGTLETRVSRSIEDVEYNNGRLEFDSELLALDNGCTSRFMSRTARDALRAAAYGFTYDLPFSDGALRTVRLFGTTLTVSPHKDAQRLNAIGAELAQQYGVRWLPSDFKKREGYKRSIELSKQYGLYRQEYCGCLYSKPVDNAAAGE